VERSKLKASTAQVSLL